MKKILNSSLKQYSMLFALIILFLAFGALTGWVNVTPMNISNMIVQNAYILILAIGMLLVIITGNIDLSVGSIVGFTGAIAGVLMINMGLPTFLVVGICLVVGVIIGMFHGYFIAYKEVPAFIVTLAGMMIFRGLTMFILNGQTLAPFPDVFQKIATGFVLSDLSVGPFNLLTIIVMVCMTLIIIFTEIKKIKNSPLEFKEPSGIVMTRVAITLVVLNFIMFSLAKYNGIPVVFIVFIAIILLYSFFMNNITYGRHIYAIGGNYEAAEMSGIHNKRIIFAVYANMGLMAALSGMIVAARLNAATPQAGNMFELDAIAACYIGGASANGGKGTIIGAIIGGLIMATLNNGMSIMGVGVDIQQTVKGVVLLIAVLFDLKSRTKKS
ncbi:multiple monosaccharide ABC transporter permease [Mollicutes bacterium LVI A0039]|nr:multiple monosaccharide ABC transporter permease [Mollicutes bacterium LVI A0039]